jgi:hypothetical protein
MPTEEQMAVNERRKYLKLMKPRYQQAKRAARSLYWLLSLSVLK